MRNVKKAENAVQVYMFISKYLFIYLYLSISIYFSTVFARVSAPCGFKLGNFSVAGDLSNIHITSYPNESRLR